MTPRVVIVRGEIEATQVDLAIKVAGRLRDKNVTIGDRVRKGDQLLTLVSPDLEAKLVQAMAASNIAEVEMQKLLLQTRTDQEQLKTWKRAREISEKAQRNFDRTKQVTVSARFQPEQKFEISEKGYKPGQTTQEDSKRTTTDNRQEENDLTIARAAHAKAVVLELKQNLQELNVVAPVDGEVAQIYIDRGELASPGAALITILDLSEVWVTANLREDLLVRFPMGGSLKGKVPALGDKQVEFKVTSIFLLQDLAHVTTKIDNHADFRIFKVRAVPTQPTEGLRPGMSVLFEVPNSSSALSKAQ